MRSLLLGTNSFLQDETLIRIAIVCPELRLVDIEIYGNIIEVRIYNIREFYFMVTTLVIPYL